MKVKYLSHLVETQGITSLSTRADTYSGITRYSVNISFPMAGQQFDFTTQEDSDTFVKMIMDAIDDVEKQPTYLEGFKDGTEYAIKLMKDMR
jgi:hypothetical protein